MLIENKVYKSQELVATGSGNPEKLLLLINEKEILYFPEYSKKYFFDQDTAVYEIILDENKNEFIKPENMASPFNLIGDACFYNFMARKIRISGKQEFFNKRGKDLIWVISGEVSYYLSGENEIKIENKPVILEGQNTVYSITGQGEVFLLKI